MYDISSIQRSFSSSNPRSAGSDCPLNHGAIILDQLLASLGEADTDAFDAALDLRWLLSNSSQAAEIVSQFYSLRSFIGESHYLACYRLRRWLETELVAWVSCHRNRPARRTVLRLDTATFNQLHERCVAEAFESEPSVLFAHVRFAFASTPLPA